MYKNYIIDKVPFNKLDAIGKEHYDKLWYCHMKNFPDIPVIGSIGTKQHAQKICNLKNGLLK